MSSIRLNLLKEAHNELKVGCRIADFNSSDKCKNCYCETVRFAKTNGEFARILQNSSGDIRNSNDIKKGETRICAVCELDLSYKWDNDII